jgi:GT2 family glycosyltransferase
MTIEFPPERAPMVSVVMVTYGGWEAVARSLRALAEYTDRPFEVIVVDNASRDDTAARLKEEVRGAKLVFNSWNAGFGPAANQGAASSVGRFLCFLNSDAFVQPGWLPPLLEAIERDARVAVAVPMLLNEDGSVQEAGAIIGREGSTLQLGFGSDPEALEYRFPRRIDYGSAACMAVRRSAFLSAGGFDPAYRVGYCEDVDLCFTLAELGLQVVYEPASKVVHARFGSSSRAAAYRASRRNRRVLARRWAHRLRLQPPIEELHMYPHRRYAARDALAPERLLVVAEALPEIGRGDPAGRLLEDLRTQLPDARITVLAVEDQAGQADTLLRWDLEVGVSPPDPLTWGTQRLHHYSAALVIGPRALQHFGRMLTETQRLAVRGYVPADGGNADWVGLRWADVVVVPSENHAEEALARAGPTPVVVVGGRAHDRAIMDVLAHLGLTGTHPALPLPRTSDSV